jgi:hypothetical protein
MVCVRALLTLLVDACTQAACAGPTWVPPTVPRTVPQWLRASASFPGRPGGQARAQEGSRTPLRYALDQGSFVA